MEVTASMKRIWKPGWKITAIVLAVIGDAHAFGGGK